MNQDNANQTIIAEEPQSSDQKLATLVNPSVESTANETQVAESVNEPEEEFTDKGEEETEDAPLEETTEAETSSPSNSPDSQPAAANLPTQAAPEVDKDERSQIEKQSYDFDHCTVQIAIQLLPDDGDVNGRMVVVGVRSHLDTPILRFVRANELGTLPPIFTSLLDELKAELPAREQAAREAFENKKAEKAKRQTTITASKTTRGKKNKATLSSAPTSSNATTDNRPRPEVNVSGAPQQQMGLF
ncbi:hypothetical protein ANRL1_01735 [Anaerolineae bacterium]|nr:hypothetical protein ANRL1_01735 [Anaerolineae bacterium]